MATKQLTLELPSDQYEFVRGEAIAGGISVAGLIRKLINDYRYRREGGQSSLFCMTRLSFQKTLIARKKYRSPRIDPRKSAILQRRSAS